MTAPPLTGRLGATPTTVVATGRAITTATRTASGLLRPAGAFTTVTDSTMGSLTATATIRATPFRLAVSLNQGLALTLPSQAVEVELVHILSTISYQMM